MFKLRFPQKDIRYWASRYEDPRFKILLAGVIPQVRKRGYFHKNEFERLSYWKSPRAQAYVRKNSAEYIKIVTQTSLSVSDEQFRIEVLTLLDGVSWPTASVVLHFCHVNPYPILDYRALWSFGVDAKSVVPYHFDLWIEYVQYCRQLSKETKISMRELDKALWQFSMENQ